MQKEQKHKYKKHQEYNKQYNHNYKRLLFIRNILLLDLNSNDFLKKHFQYKNFPIRGRKQTDSDGRQLSVCVCVCVHVCVTTIC